MTPFIRDGDVVTVAPSAKIRPSVGRVVAFIQPDTGRLVIHRVIDRQGSAFLIQGDNASGQRMGLYFRRISWDVSPGGAHGSPRFSGTREMNAI